MKNRLTLFVYLVLSTCVVAQTNTSIIDWTQVKMNIPSGRFVPRELFKINDSTLYLGCRYYLLKVSKDSLQIEFGDKDHNDKNIVRSVVSYDSVVYVSNQSNSIIYKTTDTTWVNLLDGRTANGDINWQMVEYKSQLIYTSWPRWIEVYDFETQTWTSSSMLDMRGAGFVSAFTKTDEDLFVSLYGGGVFKKYGNDWLNCNKGLSGNLNVRSVLAVNNKIFAATEQGVYYSKLNKIKWKPCKQTQNKKIKFVDLMFHDGILYTTGTNGEFFYSIDMGKNWKQIFLNNSAGYVLYSVEAMGDHLYFSADGQGKIPSGVFRIPLVEIVK